MCIRDSLHISLCVRELKMPHRDMTLHIFSVVLRIYGIPMLPSQSLILLSLLVVLRAVVLSGLPFLPVVFYRLPIFIEVDNCYLFPVLSLHEHKEG